MVDAVGRHVIRRRRRFGIIQCYACQVPIDVLYRVFREGTSMVLRPPWVVWSNVLSTILF